MSDSLNLPLFASAISAGFPSPADDYVEKKLDLNEHLVGNRQFQILMLQFRSIRPGRMRISIAESQNTTLGITPAHWQTMPRQQMLDSRVNCVRNMLS